jgi:hypothetical protein
MVRSDVDIKRCIAHEKINMPVASRLADEFKG